MKNEGVGEFRWRRKLANAVKGKDLRVSKMGELERAGRAVQPKIELWPRNGEQLKRHAKKEAKMEARDGSCEAGPNKRPEIRVSRLSRARDGGIVPGECARVRLSVDE